MKENVNSELLLEDTKTVLREPQLRPKMPRNYENADAIAANSLETNWQSLEIHWKTRNGKHGAPKQDPNISIMTTKSEMTTF